MLKNKTIFISGFTWNIWSNLTLFLAKKKANLILVYKKSDLKKEKICKILDKLSIKYKVFKWDITDDKFVENMFKDLKGTWYDIDALINLASISKRKKILDKWFADWTSTLNTNVIWTFLCSKYFYKYYNFSDKIRKIINFSSINGTKIVYPSTIDYDVSKAAIISLTKGLAKAFSPYFIVNSISPWNVDNPEVGNGNLNDENDFVDEENFILDKDIMLNRFCKITEISKVILFLLSDDSNYINWENIFLDGWYGF